MQPNKLIVILLTIWMTILGLSAREGYAQTGADLDKLKNLTELAQKYKESGESVKLAQTLSKIGMCYTENKDYRRAVENFKQSASLYLQNKYFNDCRKIYNNIGFVYTDQEEYDKALEYFEKSLKVARFQQDKENISCSLTDMAYLLTVQRRYQNSIDKLLEALKLAQEIENKQLITKCYAMLMENYRALGMTAKYQEYQTKFSDYSGHVKKEAAKQDMADLEIKVAADKERSLLEKQAFELQQKLEQAERKSENELQEQMLMRKDLELQKSQADKMHDEREKELLIKDNENKDLLLREKERQARETQMVIGGGLSFLILLLIIGTILAYNARKRKKTNRLLAEKNKEIQKQKLQVDSQSKELKRALEEVWIQKQDITDSINYAKRIQQAMMPSEVHIKQFLPESFVFFRPRDIVSGDFYWFQRIDKVIGGVHVDKVFISVIDCTGHGVPGAMLSMIGYNILDHIVLNQNIYHPDKIMEELHVQVRQSLRQDTTENHDGMDMALCVIDNITHTLEYAGAKNSLVYVDSEGEPIRVKADSHGIGGLVTEQGVRIFKNNIFDLGNKTRTYYIFSDGFSDQFGHANGRKYMAGQFRNMLGRVSLHPIEDQKKMISAELEKWKGFEQQTDDILIIGFKV